MATLDVIDGAGVARETKVAGSGTTGDPYIPSVNVDTVVPGTGATSLGKAEDAAHVSGDTGVQMLTVRKDTAAATAGTDGDYQPPITDASGRTWVNPFPASPAAASYLPIRLTDGSAFYNATSGSGGTSQGDKTSFTEGSGNMNPAGGVFNDTISADPTEDQAAALRITAKRGLHVNLRNVSGTELGTSGAPVRTDPTGSTTQPVSGTVTANAGSGTQAVSLASLPALAAGSATVGATQDAGPSWTSVWGVSGVPFTSADQSGSAVAVTDAPTGGQKLVITDLLVSVDTGMTVTFTCETTGTVIEKIYLAANSTIQITYRGKRKLATADKKLKVQTSVAGNISVDAGYFSEA